MVNYGTLTDVQRIIMATIVISTNACGIPCFVSLFRKKGFQFQAIITLMAVLTSTMYHLCEVLHCQLFLQQLKWHRLDNIFVITGVSIWILHVTGSAHARKIMYLSLVISIICQEKDPWNLNYTILPIVLFDIIAVVVKLVYWNRVIVTYNYWNIAKSLIILLFGTYFFVKGLDQFDDYLRFNHGIWHLFAALSNYYGMNCTTVSQLQPLHQDESSILLNTHQLKQF